MFGDPTDYHDFIVETGNPERLDDTLQQLPMTHAFVVGRGVPGGITLVEGNPVVRVFGNPSFFKFAVEKQGYCKIIRELEINMKKEGLEKIIFKLDAIIATISQAGVLDGNSEKVREGHELLKDGRLKLVEELEAQTANVVDRVDKVDCSQEEEYPFCQGCGIELCPCGYCHMADCREKTSCE